MAKLLIESESNNLYRRVTKMKIGIRKDCDKLHQKEFDFTNSFAGPVEKRRDLRNET